MHNPFPPVAWQPVQVACSQGIQVTVNHEIVPGMQEQILIPASASRSM
jgi:hypothetical protein